MQNYDRLQFTLVDCPGHASLIRTIIGGAQIIDMMLLVIDANKGLQTQTGECIVIGEITTDKMIVVLNKIDMIPEDERENKIEKLKKRIQKVLSGTKFPNVPIVLTSAAIGGEKVASIGATIWASGNKNSTKAFTNNGNSLGIENLIDVIQNEVRIPNRNINGPLYYAIDHCFQIKGHGTVLTGTVLSGSVSLNSIIEIPHLQIQKKVKSMQMFRKPVKIAKQGDRVGICVTNLDPGLIERGIAASPGSVPQLSNIICMVKKVRFFRQKCKTNTKFHISIGHSTVVANVTFFGATELADQLGLKLNRKVICENENENGEEVAESSDLADYLYSASDDNDEVSPDLLNVALNTSYYRNFPDLNYDLNQQFEYQHEIVDVDGLVYGKEPVQWALLEFQSPVFCPIGSLIIGSKLDIDSSDGGAMAHQCRLAFFGPIKTSIGEEEIKKIKIFNWKQKEGEVFKITDKRNGISIEAICWKLVQEGNSIIPFINMTVETAEGARGRIVAAYGADGKFRVKFNKGAQIQAGSKIVLKFKKYIYDKNKEMIQLILTPEEEAKEPNYMHIYSSKDIIIDDDKDDNEPKIIKKKKKNDPIKTVDISSVMTSTTNYLNNGINNIINNDNNKNDDNNNNKNDNNKNDSNKNDNNKNDNNDNNGSIGLIRSGVIESVKPADNPNHFVCTVKGAFRMEENIRIFIGKKVIGPNGEIGQLLGPFAKLGKCKVEFENLIDIKCEDMNVKIFAD